MAQPPIEYERLIAYAAGTLTAHQATAVETYVSEHPEAAATVARYRLAQHRVASDDSVEPSQRALARAKALFTQNSPIAETESWLSRVERFVARLVYDSRLQPAAVRYSGSGRIDLTYETDSGEIELQAERMTDQGSDRWQLMGQLSGPSSSNIRVALVSGGRNSTIAETSSDQRGVFRLDALPGHYELVFEMPQGLVSVPDLELA